MKIKSINPGSVFPSDNPGDIVAFRYTVLFDGIPETSLDYYDSANEAKQEMREEVYRLRRVHGLGE